MGRITMALFLALMREALFTTVINRAELLYGVFLMPDGKRKEKLHQEINNIFSADLKTKMLTVDSRAKEAYAETASCRKKAGKPIGQFDAMIAAVAKSHGARLATRNTKDFLGCGLTLINPWDSQESQ